MSAHSLPRTPCTRWARLAYDAFANKFAAFYELPLPARNFVSGVYASGIATFTMAQLCSRDAAAPALAAVAPFMLLAIVTGGAKVPLYRKRAAQSSGALSIGFIITLAALFRFGPHVGLLVGTLSYLSACLFPRPQPLYQLMFNVALGATEVWCAGCTFLLLNGGTLALDLQRSPAAVMVASFVAFAVNTLGVAIVIGLCTDEPPMRVWRASFGWTAPSYLAAGAVCAITIVLFGDRLGIALLFGSPIGYFAYHSYTQGTARARERQQYVDALERQTRELEEFAWIMAHDLQEPLRSVTSYTQLLSKYYTGRLDADADDFIGYAVSGAQRMKSLLVDIMRYTGLGINAVDFGDVRMRDVAVAVQAEMKELIEQSGARIEILDLPVVQGDAPQLAQLLRNLLDNGLKFRGAEPARIVVAAERSGADWTFSVSDNGIGLEQQYADRIFAIFQRLHTAEQYPGTGIGLAICRKVVERHRGRIWVESKPGGGSTFFFSLPAEQAA